LRSRGCVVGFCCAVISGRYKGFAGQKIAPCEHLSTHQNDVLRDCYRMEGQKGITSGSSGDSSGTGSYE